jgi:N utilization substance protein A
MAFTLDSNDMARIQLVEKLTRAKIKDCIDEGDDKMVIIVDNGELSKALGKKASNLKVLEGKLNKRIRMVEFAQDPIVFLTNLCKPNKITNIVAEDNVYTIIPEDIKSRGFMIGRSAGTLRLHESIMRRYFDVQELKVTNIQE